jgi:hypothetical protein
MDILGAAGFIAQALKNRKIGQELAVPTSDARFLSNVCGKRSSRSMSACLWLLSDEQRPNADESFAG